MAAAQPTKTVEQNTQSAEATAAPEASTAPNIPIDSTNDSNSDTAVLDSQKNPVKRVVDEVVSLMADIHESKQEIIARGIPFHSVNQLVELGAQNKLEEKAKMLETALESSQKQYGSAAITAEKLCMHLEKLIGLERDLGHVRQLGRQQGLDMGSINSLTLMIRQNPGDGGEKAINTFLGYAMACDFTLQRIEQIRDEVTAGPKSVLPDIPRDESPDIAETAKKKLITDICVGCALALLALTLLT